LIIKRSGINNKKVKIRNKKMSAPSIPQGGRLQKNFGGGLGLGFLVAGKCRM